MELAVESSVPWWLGIMEKFAGLPGVVGVLFIIGLIFFLKWIGEIR